MSVHSNSVLEDQLEELNVAYQAALPNKLDELQEAVSGIFDEERPEDVREFLGRIASLSHKMAGAAAMFGHEGVSDSARSMDDLCSSLLAGEDASENNTAKNEIYDLLLRMRSAAAVSMGDRTAVSQPSSDIDDDKACSILFVDDGSGLLSPLRQAVDELGYRTKVVLTNQNVIQEIRDAKPQAVVVPTELGCWQSLCKKIAEQSHALSGAKTCLLCVSAQDDFDCRLTAIRTGADGFFIEPLQPEQFIRRIEELSGQIAFDPYRILIIEDDKPQSEHYAIALEGPGNEVRVVRDPRRAQFHIAKFQPELVLVELSLGYCSGLELAKMIWQTEAGKDLPLLFLSPGPAFNQELLKLGLPEELFLKKPINSDELRIRVMGQIMNARRGASSPSRDCLVAALNNRTILSRLQKSLGWKDESCPVAPTERPAKIEKTPTVLVVDDDRFIVETIAAKLEDRGIKVMKAFNGEKGYHLALVNSPDLIISDYQMPKGSADYLLTRLKINADTRRIPVLILTAKKVGGRKDFALEREMLGRHGAVAYLNKPIDWDTLFSELRNHISF